jgi:PilZ domain-containing protein
MSELTERRRNRPRLAADIFADIIIPGKVSVAPCQVVEVSPAGARLHVSTSWILPRSFCFRLAGTTRIFQTTIVWRQGNELGVEFRVDQRNVWWQTVTE